MDPTAQAHKTRARGTKPSLRRPLLWGVAAGALQAASPAAFWWLPPATVYALELAIIAAVYIGFSVADGRTKVIAVECTVAACFAIVAAAGVTGPAWLLMVGFVAHGIKDLWQNYTQYVTNSRWWPPFCATVDAVVAVALAVALLA